MVSDSVLVIPGYNLQYAEKHTVCWQHTEGGRIGERREGGRGATTSFSLSTRCRSLVIGGEISQSSLREVTNLGLDGKMGGRRPASVLKVDI